MSVLIKAFQVVIVDWLIQSCIYKCVHSVILSNLQIKYGCYSHKGIEYSSSQGYCIGLFLSNLQVSTDAQSSFQPLQVAVTVKLVFKDPFQQKDLVVAYFFFWYSLKCPSAFQVIVFFFYSLLKASNQRVLSQLFQIPQFWQKIVLIQGGSSSVNILYQSYSKASVVTKQGRYISQCYCVHLTSNSFKAFWQDKVGRRISQDLISSWSYIQQFQ